MCDSSSDRQSDICRDFLRHACNRGKKCKFLHPVGTVLNDSSLSPQHERFTFTENICHDFQNTDCKRGTDCKLLHFTKDDQDRFLKTGYMPSHLLEEAIAKSVTPCLPGETLVCRDYLHGECRRGKHCRYRHLSHCKYRKELDILFAVHHLSSESPSSDESDVKRLRSSCAPCSQLTTNHCLLPQQVCNQACVSHDSHGCSGHVPVSTPRHHTACHLMPITYPSEGFCERSQIPQESHITSYSNSWQEENSLLKKEVFDLRRQLNDLMTANEFLLEQNATLRLMRKNGGMVTIQPPASATLNVQPASGPTIVAPVSIAPVTGGSGLALSTMPMPNASTTTQLVPVSCHAPGQQMMPVSVTGQTASAALLATAVPVSVSNTMVNVSAVPVSLATVSMAPVHMPSIVTAATQPPHSIAMSVSAATSLVSYPLVTQQPLMHAR